MANLPEHRTILEVLPHNYDEILERSQKTKNPYSREDLERMRTEAAAKNNVAMVMFLDPGFWKNGDATKEDQRSEE